MESSEKAKKGQTTIFIIIGIIIVVLAVFVILFRSTEEISKIPPSLEAPYTSFVACIEEDVWLGIRILESQGGYIEMPEFEPGSLYMPFSSQLDFLGNPLPYWYYVSGNNVQKEQVPSKSQMQRELAGFIEERIVGCDFGEYTSQGFLIEKGEPEADVIIKDNQVEVRLDMDFSIERGEDSVYIEDHNVVIKSHLGSLYKDARIVYDKEQEDLFLEERGLDVLHLYAPVDGVELTCSPLVWNADEVFDNLEEALEANTYALKAKGESDDYFVLDLNVNHNVRFLNSRNWTYTFEVAPSDGRVLSANPVGNQPGLGILGFCYVPYHFVYDLKYPVVIQIEEGDEIFQFPLAVVIQGNNARTPLGASASESLEEEFCKDKNTRTQVAVYNVGKNPIDAEIFYECGGAKCYIGKTSGGVLDEYFPQCVNGRIIARAEGYEAGSGVYSVIDEGGVDIYLDRLYDLDVSLYVNGRPYRGEALISFVSDKSSKAVALPDQETISLSFGNYSVEVYIYENSSLELQGGLREECIEVPKGGIGGLFGLTEKQCFEFEFPNQMVSKTLVGGGRQQHYILTSELEGSDTLEVYVDSLPKPKTLEDLQLNYIMFEEKGVQINFR